MPPIRTSAEERSTPQAVPEKRKSQFARKSTGGQPPQKKVKSDDSASETSESPSENAVAKPRYARKTTGGKPPPKPTTSVSPPAHIPTATSCGRCQHPPLQSPIPLGHISGFTTICGHYFHYGCYMDWLLTAASNMRTCCPTCLQPIITQGKYLVQNTSNEDASWIDISEAVQARLALVRETKHRIFINMLASRENGMVLLCLNPPEPVDVNHRTPDGFTALHLRAMANDVPAIDLLLKHGADRSIQSEVGLTALQYAQQADAGDAAARLARPD